MSSGGTLTATVVAPATPTPAAPASRRKAVTENWDDDFEFSLPAKPKTPARATPSTPKHGLGLGLGESSRDNTFPRPLDSPDSFDEDWDDPIPGPSRSTPGFPPSGSSSALPSRSNSRTNGRPAGHLQLPRSSQSQSPTLPSPSSASGSRRAPLVPSSSTNGNLRGVGDGASPVRSTLSKRSSTSFVTRSESGDLAMHGASPAHKSSPNLVDPRVTGHPVRGKRGSMLPARPASPTKGVLKMPTQPSPAKSTSAKTPELHSSPSSEQLKKPKFWKRLSAGPPSSTVATPPRRPRSASSGNLSTPSMAHDTPPVPPLPPNLRSPSVGSSSAISAMSSSPSSTTKAGPVKRLSAMLRRSSSNLSAALKQSSPSPPPLPRPPHPYTLRNAHESSASMAMSSHMPMASSSSASVAMSSHMPMASSSSASVAMSSNMPMASSSSASVAMSSHMPMASSSSSVNVSMGASPAKVFSGGPRHSASRQSLVPSVSDSHGGTTPRRPSPIKPVAQNDLTPPRTFSPGFHLPNTVAGSPYRAMAPQASPVAASPLAQKAGQAPGSDTETEEDGSTTPRRRRRVRPQSALPAPRPADARLASARFKETNTSVPVLASDHYQQPPKQSSIPSASSISSAPSFSTGVDSSPTATTASHATMSSNGFGHTTLRRITSFSKKHGRRLSGGWKFGSTSSTSSIESEIAVIQQAQVHRLEPVAGSPSKLPVYGLSSGSTTSIDIGSPTDVVMPPVPPVPAVLPVARVTAEPAHVATEPSPATAAPPPTEAAPAPKPAPSPVKAKYVESQNETWDDWDEPAPTTRSHRPRERRRMSFNDFVIPDSVLAKQKELKRGIGAVKKFAGGVDSLKSLVESHERVCNYILASGTQAETRLFVALENEYSQWWEMATVLIEVGSTGTDGASATPEVNPRRVTLATEDARVASEALRQVSGNSMNSFASGTSASSSQDVFFSAPSNGPPQASPRPEFGRASTGRHDLSKRQLEVLRTMLRTPVEASESVVPSVEQRQASTMTTRRAKHMSMPAVPVSAILPPPMPTPPRTLVPPIHHTPSPDATYIFPSPSYPSPNTASALAQPSKKSGLAGLREFLRSLKTKSSGGNGTTPAKPRNSKPPRRRPAPINLQAAERYQASPPSSPLTTAGVTIDDVLYQTQRSGRSAATGGRSPTKMEHAKKRRPSLKNIFRPSSGNWADLVRSTPPASPFAPDDESYVSISAAGKEASAPATPTRVSPTQARPGLQRPPSIPALARIKNGKYGSYASLALDPSGYPSSPTKSVRHRPSVGASDAPTTTPTANGSGAVLPFPPQPTTPTPTSSDNPMSSDSEATLRLKSRVKGLGHPSDSSPARTASSPARPSGVGPELMPPPEETPRSRSDYGPRAKEGDMVIALTPENLPVLLDYVQQCERRLDEWRRRADRLGVSEPAAGASGMPAAGEQPW